jgi:hypothetical protein
VVELKLPMTARWKAAPDNPAVAALSYGLLVLAGRCGSVVGAGQANWRRSAISQANTCWRISRASRSLVWNRRTRCRPGSS